MCLPFLGWTTLAQTSSGIHLNCACTPLFPSSIQLTHRISILLPCRGLGHVSWSGQCHTKMAGYDTGHFWRKVNKVVQFSICMFNRFSCNTQNIFVIIYFSSFSAEQIAMTLNCLSFCCWVNWPCLNETAMYNRVFVIVVSLCPCNILSNHDAARVLLCIIHIQSPKWAWLYNAGRINIPLTWEF